MEEKLAQMNIEYCISEGDTVITNTGAADPEYYRAAPVYCIKEPGLRADYSADTYHISDDVFDGFDSVYLKINDEFAAEIAEKWEAKRAAVERSFIIAAAMMIAAIMCMIYSLWVCGRRGDDGDDDGVHMLLIDRMYAEINLAVMCAGFFAVIFGIMIMLEEAYLNESRVLSEKTVIYLCSFMISAQGAVFLSLMMSIFRNLKNRTFLKSTLTFTLIKLFAMLLKYALKFVVSLIKRIFGIIKRVFKKSAEAIGRISGNLRRALFKRTGVAAAVILITHTATVMLFSFVAYEDNAFIFIPLISAAVISYILIKKLADADRIKEGIFEIKNGNTDFKIRDVSGIMKDVADAVNSIGEGAALAAAREVKAERMKSQLITNVSHDLKTPLTSVINYAELLCGEKLEPSEANEYARIIYNKAQQLKKLTSDLFDISKAQSGSEEVYIERLDINLLINQALAEQEDIIKESGLDFETETDGEIYVTGDGKKLSRVLENLIINAVKYSLKGTRVYITTRRSERECLLEIKNIASYRMNFKEDEITERFVRGDISRSTEGSGLGLAIAKSYTALCGGKFEIIVDGDLFKARITLAAG